MPDTAAVQLNRIVQLVAELSRREREGGEPVTLKEVADHLDTKPSVILRDIRVLTDAADDPDATWLMSMFAYQEGECITVSSRGPYQRPIRLTPDELLALQVAIFFLVEKYDPPLWIMIALGLIFVLSYGWLVRGRVGFNE